MEKQCVWSALNNTGWAFGASKPEEAGPDTAPIACWEHDASYTSQQCEYHVNSDLENCNTK